MSVQKFRRVKYRVYNPVTRQFVEGEGNFHQWAASYVEFETGPGNFTFAIVEKDDGTIVDPTPSEVQFLPDPQ